MRSEITPDKYFPKGIEEKVTLAVLIRRIIGLSVFAILTMFILGFFSAAGHFLTSETSPNPLAYHYLAENQAMIKVSISHSGKRITECKKRTKAELKKLPPNMRAAMSCERERTPVLLVMTVNDEEVYRHVSRPKGLSKDGASIFYQKLVVPTGVHEVSIQMRDSVRDEGYDFEYKEKIELVSGRNFVVTFDEQNQNFKVY
ncbi:MAG: hypothetical protein OQK35_01385 [Alphaproteobacteria bacterium]|nr:hypothetical protein [Rhodospirillales bacterium]MCW9044963.1 hypothetical protein [Alphaproteobacteria bacterium]